jgi:hypothetical protein
MIPYEELADALDRYAARISGAAQPARVERAAPPENTAETVMPPVAAREDTGPQPIYDEPSSEIELGEVDEETSAH